jgi:predicted GIY-YIG superfamily endonuclease
MNNYTLYLCTFKNGKSYVGITNNYKNRVYQHLWQSKKSKVKLPFHKALAKYKDSAVWSVLHTELTLDQARDLEKTEILAHNSKLEANGYNCTEGGEGTSGYKKSDKSIQKWKNSTKDIFQSKEYRAKASSIAKECLNHPESKLNMSKGQKKRYSNLEELDKLKQRVKKTHSTAKVKLAMSEGQKERFSNPEEIKKLQERTRLLFQNKEFKEKHALSLGCKEFCAMKDGIVVGIFLTQNDCSTALGLNRVCICRCLNNKQKAHKGYTFKYKE